MEFKGLTKPAAKTILQNIHLKGNFNRRKPYNGKR
jgi:hypothetical protein